jgi:hypothetical protein
MAEDLEQTIRDAAASPVKASGDEGAVEQRSIDELIKADRHLANKAAQAGKGLGIKHFKLVPPGAC